MPEEKSVLSLISEYEAAILKEVTLDELNLRDIQMILPAKRHYWVGRLMYHKSEIYRLGNLKKEAKKRILEKIQKESPVGIDSRSIQKSLQEHDVMQKIELQIAEHELVVEYLTKIEANFRSLSFDLKNLIEIQKLETT
jgi:hypothetical protein